MMKNIPPLKRSKQLVSLSREHHDALLFIWKIREGLKNGTPASIIIDYVNWFWESHLKEHFDSEERILLPYLNAADPLTRQLQDEHAAIRKMIEAADSVAISSFADLLNDHIRFEERQLFPHLEKTTSASQLDKIASQLEDHSTCKTEWQIEFWKKAK